MFSTRYDEIVLAILRSHRVPFLITGAAALKRHGYTRPTHDLDLFVSPDHMPELRAALEAYGVTTNDIPFEKASQGILVRLGQPPDLIDISTSLHGVTFAEAYASRAGDFMGFDALLANKLASPREKDHRDAAELMGILRKRWALGI